jgi:glycosyltransferase involved in cell wall biosynthesis
MQHLKFPREVFLEATEPEKLGIGIFLGVYNGSTYLSNLKSQLLNQTSQNFHLVVVDNNSTDDSYELIKEWSENFESRITILRNSINLGGSGTIVNSLDLIKTNWFTAFHQDDFYKPEHIEVLLNEINRSHDKVVAISTVMASMEADGSKVGTIPRSSMFAKSNHPVSAFIQNLKIHSVPWPATAFKREVFEKSQSLWHSTAFPDTEQILRMCAYGEFITIEKETMYYRENPFSESHTVKSSESELGTALSLFRVFGSSEFKIITSQLNAGEIELFGIELINAIDFRLKESALGGFLSLYAIEMLIQNTGYHNARLVLLAHSFYQNLESTSTARLLLNLGKIHNSDANNINLRAVSSVDNFVKIFKSKDRAAPYKRNSFDRLIRCGYFQKLPYSWKKYIIRTLVNFGKLLGKFDHFRFGWK